MAKLKITTTGQTNQIKDAYVSPTIIDGAHYGGTGGLTSQTGLQLQPQVKVGTNSATAGSILFQKGAHKFRVQDAAGTPNIGTCTLVNLATPTASNTMSLQVNLATLSGATVTSYTASTSTTAYVTGYTLAGPVALAVGQAVTGAGTLTGATISAISSGNITLTYASQTNSNVSGVAVSTTVYASRITNKFVYDFGSDNNAIAGENGVVPTYYTSGYNPNKYRYRLATPDSTFVQVKSA